MKVNIWPWAVLIKLYIWNDTHKRGRDQFEVQWSAGHSINIYFTQIFLWLCLFQQCQSLARHEPVSLELCFLVLKHQKSEGGTGGTNIKMDIVSPKYKAQECCHFEPLTTFGGGLSPVLSFSSHYKSGQGSAEQKREHKTSWLECPKSQKPRSGKKWLKERYLSPT